MTPKQILDSFSETLLRDERILSARERALVLAILQHARAATNGNADTRAGVEAAIASAVGEAVAQRAFGVLGGSIVERILESAAANSPQNGGSQAPLIYAGQNPGPDSASQPQPPHIKRPEKDFPGPPQPQPEPPHLPQPDPQPQPPHRRAMGPNPGPEPQPQPQPPHTLLPDRRTAILEGAIKERPQCVVLDEFLAPQELDDLRLFALNHEIDFRLSEVVSPSGDAGMVNYDHRRSRVFMELEGYRELILQRLQPVLPQVCERLGMETFSVRSVEAQITASNDGDFFHCHNDNGDGKVASRHLTFVYFFHREPRAFEGGDLVIYRDQGTNRKEQDGDKDSRVITPQQNQMVFFPCELTHEITAVKCASQAFADSRFTLNGWLHW